MRCWRRVLAQREAVAVSYGGGGSSDDAFLVGPFLEWWDKHTAKRDARRTKRAEAKAARLAKKDDPRSGTKGQT